MEYELEITLIQEDTKSPSGAEPDDRILASIIVKRVSIVEVFKDGRVRISADGQPVVFWLDDEKRIEISASRVVEEEG